MTICNITEICTILEHANIICQCEDADWVQEYQDKNTGKSPCRCIECIDEIEV